MGYGCHRVVHDADERIQLHRGPLVVEVVDTGGTNPGAPCRIQGDGGGRARDGEHSALPVRVARWVQARSESRGAMLMQIEGEGQRVTVYSATPTPGTGRTSRLPSSGRCRKLGVAGATASRGVMGFGKHSRIHRAHMPRQPPKICPRRSKSSTGPSGLPSSSPSSKRWSQAAWSWSRTSTSSATSTTRTPRRSNNFGPRVGPGGLEP